MNDVFSRIRVWASDRNLINGSTQKDQFCKLVEEVAEARAAVRDDNQPATIDGVGDALVVMTIMAAQGNVSVERLIALYRVDIAEHQRKTSALQCLADVAHALARGDDEALNMALVHLLYPLGKWARNAGRALEECAATAYEEIKDRKGRMVDGVFVKEADL